MDLSRFIILVQCSAIGIGVSLLLVALLLRQKNSDAGARIGIMLGICVFAMYASIGEVTTCVYFALPNPGWIIHLLIWILTLVPALIVWSWRESPVLRWKSRASFLLVFLALTSGCIVVLISHWFGPHPNQNQTFQRVLAMQRFLCLAPAVVCILRLPLDARLKTFMKVTSSAYLAASSINALRTPGQDYGSLYGVIVMLVAQTCALFGILGSFIVAARFRLVDVFIRWSTRVTIFGVLSLVASLSFIFWGNRASAAHRAIGLSACSAELVVLLFLGMTLTERCERWVTSHVLQRLDLRAEAARLHRLLSNVESKEQLVSFVETELTRRLEVRDIRVIPRSSLPQGMLALEDAANAPLEISANSVPLPAGPLEDVDVLIPIPSTEEMIGVSTGAGRRPLNSGEIGFLKDLGHDLGLRLHHLDVEAAQRRLAMRETLLRQQLTEAELRALRAQVNPHFLFNSLNTIADLIVRDPERAERMTLRLSSVFRHVLTQSDRQFVIVHEEFEFLRNYLDIEQERFGDSLQVRLTINPEVDEIRIPALLLQPLVENALKHGLGPKGGQRSLFVTACVSEGKVLLEVVDDGVGFATSRRSNGPSRTGSGVGLANTRARLHAVYGKEGSLEIASSPMNGCRVTVSIPFRRVQS